MDFMLVYRGPLKANGSVQEKQDLRRIFHPQLRELWEIPPISTSPKKPSWLSTNPPQGTISIIEPIGSFRFAPLISSRIFLVAELNITLLRPENAGSIVTQGGDIDNRIKTLLDSLRMPRHSNEIPSNDSPQYHEDPFFCLLQDDSLITKLAISTYRLLEPSKDPSFVSLFIHVQSKATQLVFANMDLA